MNSFEDPVCFICATRQGIIYSGTNPQHKILLEYLLNSVKTKLNDDVYNDMKSKLLKTSNIGARGNDKDGQIMFCMCCDQLAEVIMCLRLELEVTQMKIIEKLKSVKDIIGFQDTNTNVKAEVTTWSHDMADIIRKCISEIDKREFLVPLVYLKRFEPQDRHINAEESTSLINNRPMKRRRKQEFKIKNEYETLLPRDGFANDPQEFGNDHEDNVPLLTQDVKGYDGDFGFKMPRPKMPKKSKKGSKSKRSIPPGGIHTESSQQGQGPVEVEPTSSKTKKMKFCEMCPFHNRSNAVMEQHLLTHETSDKPFKCLSKDCLGEFSNQQLYERHKQCHVSKQGCDVCRKYVIIVEMKNHIMSEHSTVYSCPQCSAVYGNFSNLIAHSRYHTGILLKCQLCSDPEIYTSRAKLKMHLFNIHQIKEVSFQCDEPTCSKTFFDEPTKRAHMISHSKRFECAICGVCTTSKTTLDVHMRNVHDKKPTLQCDMCPEKFCYVESLRSHKILVHAQAKLRCTLCEKEYVTKTGLSDHMINEHGAGDCVQCSQCPQKFARESQLKKHMVKHSETKDFACEICGFVTRTINLLNTHRLKHNGEKKFACPYCPKSFAKNMYLTDHIRIHTKEKPFKCDECGTAFSQRGSLNLHRKKLHSPSI